MQTPQNLRLGLVVGGQRYEGWQEVRVTAGIERTPSDFDIQLTEKWPGQDVQWRIRPGDECQVMIGDDLVLTGYIDDFNPSYDTDSHKIRVAGRSMVADLVDCSALLESGQLTGLTLLQIAEKLCRPFGIKVVAEVGLGGPLPDVQLQQGESVYGLLERLSRLRKVLVCDDENGNLVFTRPGRDRAQGALRQGVNVKSAAARLSQAERYSDYIVKGQQTGSDELFGPDASEVMAAVKDGAVTRYRPLVIVAESNLDNAMARDRAEWEMRRRGGRAVQTDIVSPGWRQLQDGKAGRLWRRNLMVPVESEFLGIDRELALGEVTYLLGPQGTLCSMTLAPPEAFTPEPPSADDLLGKGAGWADIVPISRPSATGSAQGGQ